MGAMTEAVLAVTVLIAVHVMEMEITDEKNMRARTPIL